MKRIISYLLAAVLLVSALSTVTFASETETPDEDPTVKNITGSTVTVDGERKPEEGWAEIPYLLLDTVWSKEKPVEKPAEKTMGDVSVSYDSDYLYLYVNNTNADSPIRVILDLDGSGRKTVGNWLNFCFYNWNYTGGRSAGAVEGSSLQLDINCEFYTMYSKTDHVFWQKTAWHGFGNNGLAAMEMKIPMTEELKAGIANKTVKLGVSVCEKYTSSEGYGYYAPKVPLNFEPVVTVPQVIGCQVRDNGETYDIRFAAVIGAVDLETAKAGFRLTYDGKTADVNCAYVYTAISGTDGVHTAGESDGYWLICYTVCGFRKDKAYAMDVAALLTPDAKSAQAVSESVLVNAAWDSEAGRVVIRQAKKNSAQ